MGHTTINPDVQVSLIIFGTILLFYLYFYFSNSELIEKYAAATTSEIQQKLRLFFLRKLSGFLILGALPAILYYFLIDHSFEKFGLNISMFQSSIPVVLVLVCIIIFLLFIVQLANKQRNSLQIDITEWNTLLFTFNAIGWIIYLIGYEFLFRGILLFECYSVLGFWPSIAINVVIYSAIHMVNGKEQALGAMVFGIIACYFTLIQGTIFIPIFMHITLSIFSDFFSIRYNEGYSFGKSLKKQ